MRQFRLISGPLWEGGDEVIGGKCDPHVCVNRGSVYDRQSVTIGGNLSTHDRRGKVPRCRCRCEVIHPLRRWSFPHRFFTHMWTCCRERCDAKCPPNAHLSGTWNDRLILKLRNWKWSDLLAVLKSSTSPSIRPFSMVRTSFFCNEVHCSRENVTGKERK